MNEVGFTDQTGRRTSCFAPAGERILYAGLAAGLSLPHECATGTCGSCKMTVLVGETASLWQGAPAARLCRGGNEILTCQTTALGPVELSTRSSIRDGTPTCGSFRGTLSHRRLLTKDVARIGITLDRPLSYLPGQFVTISGFGVVGPRAYSMTRHTPFEPGLEFLVGRNPAGGFTPPLFDRWIPGEAVEVFGPLGRATLRPDDERPFYAIAGGTGIAGVLAILDWALETGYLARHPSHLFFGLRDTTSAYLLDHLSRLKEQAGGGLTVTVALSDDASFRSQAVPAGLQIASGLVHEVARARIAAEGRAGEHIHFVGGPPAMVNATMRMLVLEQKVSPAEIRYDRFG